MRLERNEIRLDVIVRRISPERAQDEGNEPMLVASKREIAKA
jgi:hypothetical protein